MNSTDVLYFHLASYTETGSVKYLYFSVILVVYVLVVSANVFLVAVIYANRSLHEPMYLLLCSLFVNELYGSTGLFPFLLLQILSDLHTVSASFCFLQIFCLYSYGAVEFFTLAAMSYDRYLAICHPLRYHTRMSLQRMGVLAALTWLYPLLINLLIVYLMTAPLQLCGNVINKVYCDNYYVVKLACSDTSVNNVFGLVHMFTVILGLILLILYSYVRILRVCFSTCTLGQRQKALSTCTPHLASLVNFSFGCFFEIVQSRFSLTLPSMLSVVLSLYWLTIQPLINPLLYGLKMSRIRAASRTFLLGKEAGLLGEEPRL